MKEALVIAGSDKRGTIYGIYELSRQMGVSPWYWWADVPARHQDNIYIKRGVYTDGEPKVAYRGIFINDEWPSFGNWCNEKFGGINSKVYKHVFELLLRLKANYMWPAMWGSAFYDDDPQNGILADRMGIVMDTSRHEVCISRVRAYIIKRIYGVPVFFYFSVVTIGITTLYTVFYRVTTNAGVSTRYIFCSQPAGAMEKVIGAREKFRDVRDFFCDVRDFFCGVRDFLCGARGKAGVVVTLRFCRHTVTYSVSAL